MEPLLEYSFSKQSRVGGVAAGSGARRVMEYLVRAQRVRAGLLVAAPAARVYLFTV